MNNTRKFRALELMDLALKINGTEANEHGTCVFFNFSGHVGLITVRVYKDGWTRENEPMTMDAYVDNDREMEAIFLMLLQILNEKNS